MKRWCDAGIIPATKTAGGHRRFRRAEVIAFLKHRQQDFHDPSAIGLPDFSETSVADSADARRQLLQALIEGDETKCTRLILFLYIKGMEMFDLVDQVLAPTFVAIGDRWAKGELDVYQERRACEICLNALRELRTVLTAPGADSMTAIGGAIEQDQYSLPTLSIELTMTSLGWKAESLGNNLPLTSLLNAAMAKRPDLMWISASHIADSANFIESFNRFASQIPSNTTLVVGGRAVTPELRNQIKNAICCDNHSQLAAAVSNLQRNRRISPSMIATPSPIQAPI